MAEDGNYIELRFTNAMMLDIFSRYASDSELAGFVAEDGSHIHEVRDDKRRS